MRTAAPLLLAALLWMPAPAHAALPKCGDVNDNGSINASDALAALQRAVDDGTELDCGPRGKLLRTGQTACFDAEGAEVSCEGSPQAGAVNRGIARSSSDNDDGTITDEVTGLVWEKLSDDGSIHDRDTLLTWEEAFDKIDQLNAAELGGHDDWRLPNAFELLTLANLGRTDPAYYAAHFAKNCEPDCSAQECSCVPSSNDSWSSTTYVAEPDRAWLVSAADGRLFSDEKSALHTVRAVRGGYIVESTGSAAGAEQAQDAGSPCGDVDLSHTVTASDALAILKAAVGQEIELRCSPRAETLQTGQTECYDSGGAQVPCAGTGQDGELRMGAPRAFRDNGDGTITDLATGLMWEKLADDGTIHDMDNAYTWADAFADKIIQLNTTMFAGYDNWRLPNIFELVTLLDLGSADTALHAIFSAKSCDDGCSVTMCSCAPSHPEQWSSSTYAAAPAMAWAMHLDDGATVPQAKSETAAVRAVRAGN
ncbi:MAG TPA: DUF1566 domain-containing protein [Candidatus Limnocylindrales bacterium]|nr:DUF1566 domain-containing protein [Candidatus Limnocylindrales bacterium]